MSLDHVIAAMLGADAWIRAVVGIQKTRRVAPVRLKRALTMTSSTLRTEPNFPVTEI